MLKRREFLKLLGASVAGAAMLPFGAAAKAAEHEWKMVLTWPKTLPGLGTGATRLAKRIEALSEGRISIKLYGGGELVPPLGVFDAVSTGTAELGHTGSYYWMNKSKAAAFFCAVPGGMTAQEHAAWLYFDDGQRLWDELYAEFGLKAFPAGNTGTQMGGWFNREITSIDDFKGLKMRIPGLGGEVLNRMGGAAQAIPPQELFTALQSGVIDALEWVGPWNDMALGFHKAAKYYYGPGVHEGGATLECMVNKKAYDALPVDLQRVVKTACAVENALMHSEFTANNYRGFATLEGKNIDIRHFPDSVTKKIFDISQEVVKEIASESNIAQKIYQSFSKFRKVAIDYSDVTEYGFMHGRRNAVK